MPKSDTPSTESAICVCTRHARSHARSHSVCARMSARIRCVLAFCDVCVCAQGMRARMRAGIRSTSKRKRELRRPRREWRLATLQARSRTRGRRSAAAEAAEAAVTTLRHGDRCILVTRSRWKNNRGSSEAGHRSGLGSRHDRRATRGATGAGRGAVRGQLALEGSLRELVAAAVRTHRGTGR